MADQRGGPIADDFPAAFCLLNDRLRPKRTRAVLERLAAAGFRNAVLQPMPDDFRRQDFIAGMTTPYLSERYFAAIRVAVQQAEALGLGIWLYDEGGWPSGQANGLLLARHPHLRAQVRTSAGLRPVTPARSDKLHPDTARCFIALTHEGYRRAVGEYFGTTIRGFFTDEPCFDGQIGTAAIPWTDDIPACYSARYGRELAPDLPLLFGAPASRAAAAARQRYGELVTDLFVERFVAPLTAYCQAHQLKLIGHFLGDQSLRGHARCTGDLLKALRALSCPGVDVIWGQIDPLRPRNFSSCFAASARSQPEQAAWSESFGAYGHGLPVQHMKWVCDVQLLQGITHFALMWWPYSRRDGRWLGAAGRALDFGPDAEYVPLLNRYLAETGSALRTATIYRPLRVPYPVRELWTRYDRQTSSDFNRRVGELVDHNLAFSFDASARWQSLAEYRAQFARSWPFANRVLAPRGIRWLAMARPDGDWCFCVNTARRALCLQLEPAGYRFRLAAKESRWLRLDRPERPGSFSRRLALTAFELRAMASYEVVQGDIISRPTPGAWRRCTLGSWRRNGLALGVTGVQYRTKFTWSAPLPAAAVLDLGVVNYAVRVTLNGQHLASLAWSPFRIEVGPHLQLGENHLQLEVSGSVAPLLCDPAVQRQLRAAGRWNQYLDRALGLERQRVAAGLVGPVVLRWPGRSAQPSQRACRVSGPRRGGCAVRCSTDQPPTSGIAAAHRHRLGETCPMQQRFTQRAGAGESAAQQQPMGVRRVHLQGAVCQCFQHARDTFLSSEKAEAIDVELTSGNELCCQSQHLWSIKTLELANANRQFLVAQDAGRGS